MNTTFKSFSVVKNFLSGVFGLIFIVFLFVAGIFLLEGTVLIGEKILPFLSTITSWLSLVFFLVLIPMGVSRKMRRTAGGGAVAFSYISGFTLWFYSAVATYYLWGLLAIIIGLGLFGIGVLPIALLASLFEADWGLFWNLAYMIALTYGSRMFGVYLLSKAEQEEYSASYQHDILSADNNKETDAGVLDAEIEDERLFCANCGKTISSEASFCRFCGNKR